MTEHARRGVFISFEGIDGSGKSTQARALAAALPAQLTREPGGSEGAEEIRRLLVEGAASRWSAETEILLFTAARRDHLEKTIAPALKAGSVIVSDRFADSTRVYQGAARAALRAKVDQLHEAMIGLEPDLTFVIDMDPEIALRRGLARDSGEDRFESLGLDFQHKLRAGFLALAQEYPDRVRVIDGSRAVDAVAADVQEQARRFLSGGSHV
ncbi:dTMP kinase [Pararhodobacter sp.]|uniref:dTMP kinase n=1 Tax=Pararhodobacter sp. TaxID=2127056 RepID=UPI002B0018D8|nr:dTMP kinase [Pararhodobacter sp.]